MFDVPVAMRDGAVLRANVYRPTSVESAPVLLMRLPYGKDLPPRVPAVDPAHAARRGGDVVVQDTRGRCASDAVWDAFRRYGYRRASLRKPVLAFSRCSRRRVTGRATAGRSGNRSPRLVAPWQRRGLDPMELF